MSEVSPLLFGAAVFALVALLVIVPRIAEMRRRPNAHDMYFSEVEPIEPWARPAEPETTTPLGAPRALSPLAVKTEELSGQVPTEPIDTRR